MPLDGRRGVEGEGAEELHAHDGVDEEEHAHQQAHVGKSLQFEIRTQVQSVFPGVFSRVGTVP